MNFFLTFRDKPFAKSFSSKVIGVIKGSLVIFDRDDLIQSIVMSVALISVVLFGIKTLGGMDVIASQTASMKGYLSLTSVYNEGTAVPYGSIKIASTLAWGLGYFGMPHVLLRFMAISDENKIKLSRRIATIKV